MIQTMIQFQSAPESRVSGVSPTAVLFRRRVVGAKFSVGDQVVERPRDCSVQSVLSSGCRMEFRKCCVSGVSGVSRVPVKRRVASQLSSSAFATEFSVPAFSVTAFGPRLFQPNSGGPQNVLRSTFQKSRRAAAVAKLLRLQQRLATKTKIGGLRQLSEGRRSSFPSVLLRDVQ